MFPKEEAQEIFNEINKISFVESIQFETGFSDVEIDLPDWVIKKVACIMIDKIPHTKGSITIDYWEEVKTEINKL